MGKQIYPGVTPSRLAKFNAKHPEIAAKYKGRDSHAYQIRRSYGLAYVDYQRMYAIQGGRCAICRTPQERLSVDHCHTTNRVRGLLCNHCNHALGFIRENALAARALVLYIENRCEPCKAKGPIGTDPNDRRD